MSDEFDAQPETDIFLQARVPAKTFHGIDRLREAFVDVIDTRPYLTKVARMVGDGDDGWAITAMDG